MAGLWLDRALPLAVQVGVLDGERRLLDVELDALLVGGSVVVRATSIQPSFLAMSQIP